MKTGIPAQPGSHKIVLIVLVLWILAGTIAAALLYQPRNGSESSGIVPATPNPVLIRQAQQKIKHVVFMVLENRSFDNVFGRFPGADGTTVAQDATLGTFPLLHSP